MTIIHANDPTTKVLSLLYDTKEYNYMRIDERSTNAEVQNIIRGDDLVIMLGHVTNTVFSPNQKRMVNMNDSS